MQSKLIIRNRYNILKRMQIAREFNILVIGRSGSGKSATTKLLTGNPAIKVANSLKEVTTDVNYYEGTSFETAGEEVRFRILDIPGLDKINNRAYIREKILQKLQTHAISLHAIVYVSSLTERDTMDQHKLFSFLQQLPWGLEQKKLALIPLFTKYDNLVIDSQEEDVISTKKEYQQIFEKLEYGAAWGKRIYWINQTKSLQFKIKCYQEIREKYQKQIERLVEMLKKNKQMLTAKAIRTLIEQQDRFILKQLFSQLQTGLCPFKKQMKSHSVLLKVHIQPHTIQDSFTAVSASSIGIFISKVCHKQVKGSFSIILMGVPIAIALLKLAAETVVFYNKKLGQNSSGQTVMLSYEHICKQINNQMENQWKNINQLLEFKVKNGYLRSTIPILQHCKFFDLTALKLSCDGNEFKSNIQKNHMQFDLPIPNFKQQIIWTPQIRVSYSLKKYDQQDILKRIQTLRKEFCSRI